MDGSKKWKTHHNLKYIGLSVESFVKFQLVLHNQRRNVYPKYIFSIRMKQAALPEKGFAEKGKVCKGGKKSKLRLTIANVCGKKELSLS